MKRKVLILLFAVATQLTAMDSGSFRGEVRSMASQASLDQQIGDILERRGGNIEKLEWLLQQRMQVPPVKRGRGSRVDVDPLYGAQEAAERNLARAKGNLTWCGNTGRRNKLVGGVLALALGAAQSGYNIAKFWVDDDDADKTAAGFGVAGGGVLALGGIYGIKLAIENGDAETEYDKAVAMKLLVETLAGQRQSLVAADASSSSSSVYEVGIAGDDSVDSEAESTGSSGATSHGSSSSFLSTTESSD